MHNLNKRGDIPVVILVLGVIALMIFGLLSFYLVGGQGKEGGINSALNLQEVYNIAESAKFSDESLAHLYGVSEEEGKFVLDKTVSKKEGIRRIEKEIFKIKYTFDK